MPTPLATTNDLAARGIASSFAQVETFLATASEVVREAAGAHISRETSTISLPGYAGEQWLTLPGAPIVSVAEVEVDGDVVEGWRLADGRLWRARGWGEGCQGEPSTVTVTYTHGLAQVPEDIIDLVCRMVAATKSSLDVDPDGLGLALNNGTLQSIAIDGVAESYATAGDAIAAVTEMMLPDRTRLWLAKRFGGGVATLVSR